MTSELNLTDEGELQEEEKPRLVIGDNVPPSLHHGHKLDMKDRDPIKMNDHVKVRYELYLFGVLRKIVALVSCNRASSHYKLQTVRVWIERWGCYVTTLTSTVLSVNWHQILNLFSFLETSNAHFNAIRL